MFFVGVIFHFFIGLFFGLWSFYFAMLGILSYTLLNAFDITFETKIFHKIRLKMRSDKYFLKILNTKNIIQSLIK